MLVSGGTSAAGGSCMVYRPGRTACLSCRMDIDALAAQEQQPQGCDQMHEASVVTSNAITGALMVLGLRQVLAGQSPPEIWEYDGRVQDEGIGVRSERPACRCHLTA